MTPDLLWAIGVVVAVYATVRWVLPALGLKRGCCGNCSTANKPYDELTPTEDERLSGTVKSTTEATVQGFADRRRTAG